MGTGQADPVGTSASHLGPPEVPVAVHPGRQMATGGQIGRERLGPEDAAGDIDLFGVRACVAIPSPWRW